MKVRKDFVTNSSSASYIICFARIADEEKANPIIEKYMNKPGFYNIDTYTKDEVEEKKDWSGTLGAEWAGAEIYSVDKVLEKYPDDKYVIITEYLDAEWDDEIEDDVFSYDFEANEVIEKITEENGFANIEIAEGEGRDG